MKSKFLWIGVGILAGISALFLIFLNINQKPVEPTPEQALVQQITESVKNTRGHAMQDLSVEAYGEAINAFGLEWAVTKTFYYPDGTKVPDEVGIVGQYKRASGMILLGYSYYEEAKADPAMSTYVNFFVSHEICHHIIMEMDEISQTGWESAYADEALDERLTWACAELLYLPPALVGEIGKFVPAEYVPTDAERKFIRDKMVEHGVADAIRDQVNWEY